MNKEHMEELLESYYDQRRALTDLMKFYEHKLSEHLDLKYIYTTWLSDTQDKLNGIDIDIQYLQEELKLKNE